MRIFVRLAPALLVLSALSGACREGGTSSSTSSSEGGRGGEGGVLPPAQPLRVLNWNTHNFFDNIDDHCSGEIVLGTNDYKNKRKAIGAALKALDPDVIMLQEVEKKSILDDLNESELDGQYVSTELIPGNDTRCINVGVMSKIALDGVVSHKDEYFNKWGTQGPDYRYARDCLEAHITFNGRRIALLGVHFRAKMPDDDANKRLAEAQHTRDIADALTDADPSMAVIVLGDYNDTPGSAPVKAITGKAPSIYVDAADAVASAYSFVYQGTPELIDHQMGDPRASSMLDKSSVILQHGPGIDDSSAYASDHAPIFAIYDVR